MEWIIKLNNIEYLIEDTLDLKDQNKEFLNYYKSTNNSDYLLFDNHTVVILNNKRLIVSKNNIDNE